MPALADRGRWRGIGDRSGPVGGGRTRCAGLASGGLLRIGDRSFCRSCSWSRRIMLYLFCKRCSSARNAACRGVSRLRRVMSPSLLVLGVAMRLVGLFGGVPGDRVREWEALRPNI